MNKKNLFTISGAIQEGWRLTKANLGFFLGYQIIMWILIFLFSGDHAGLGWWLINLAGWVLIILVKMGLYKSALLVTQGVKPGFDQLYINWRLILSWVVASLLFGLMVGIGFVLLVVPGFYLWARFGLYPFFILDKGLGPFEALEEASKATENIRWPIFLLFVVCALIDLLGFIVFGVGILIATPVTLLALAGVYRQIIQADERNNAVVA